MEQELLRLSRWANHGTVNQFFTEVSAKLMATPEYEVARENGGVNFYRIQREGGFLGLGRKKVRQLVLKIEPSEGELHLDADGADSEFVHMLSKMLKQH